MSKKCVICKQPADITARITRGDQSHIVDLCDNCSLRISNKYRLEVIDSHADLKEIKIAPRPNENNVRTSTPTANMSNQNIESHNTWRTAFFALLFTFLAIELFTLFWMSNKEKSDHSKNQTVANTSQTVSYNSDLKDVDASQTDTSTLVLQEYNIGETIFTDNWEITLNRVEFSQCISEDEHSVDYYMPIDIQITDEMRLFGGDSTNIVSREDRVLVSVSYTVKYLGKTATTYRPSIDLDFDNGYIYTIGRFAYEDTFGYSESKFRGFEPKGQTVEFRGYANVPIEIQNNTEAPLKVVFRSVDDIDYMYRIR